jgi:AcrR family transcriptional regulator
MLTLSTPDLYDSVMAVRPARRVTKRPRKYHHGDLSRALVEEALRTIQTEGVRGLTLRGVGQSLGVSRTALYRHFADKNALLAAVARQGFRTFRLQLLDAWERGGRGREGFQAMGLAYVRFAVANPSHYRVMFGGFIVDSADTELRSEGMGAFQVLVDAIVSLQQHGLMRPDDPLQLAGFIWSQVHGVAMLVIDGQLHGPDINPDVLTQFAIERLWTGVDMRT